MMRVVVVVVVMVAWRGEAVTTKTRFLKLDASRGDGSVLLSKSVSTRLECAALCAQLSGVGYNMELAAENPNNCTVLGTQTGILADGNSTLYCGICKILGDLCSVTADCTLIEPAAVCSAGVCVCPDGYATNDGVHCTVVPAAFGASCTADVQCQATTNYTVCSGSPKTCVCNSSFNVNSTNNGCVFDYAGNGFTSQNGRVVKIYGLFGSWDDGMNKCNSVYAQMYMPLSSSDWNWMDKYKLDATDLGVAFPINDKASDGNIVWNNGSAVGSVAYLQWTNNDPFATNTPFSNCVGMYRSTFATPAYISFLACGAPFPASPAIPPSVICEAPA
ncbi:uncharacterized protein [Procambarus clarkii]|uniref:uncharacterized protein n=1 Tax=Procambarus clarkii TaxID=6728 RepID=UPI0037446730